MDQHNLPDTANKICLPGLYPIRDALGFQQAVLAQMSGVSIGHISRIESGLADCKIEVCAKLANALGVTPNDLIFEPSKIRISQLRLAHLRKLVAEELAKLEDLQVAAICGDDEEEAA